MILHVDTCVPMVWVSVLQGQSGVAFSSNQLGQVHRHCQSGMHPQRQYSTASASAVFVVHSAFSLQC